MLPFHATDRQIFGATIEEWVLSRLISQGYAARLISRWGDAFDLVIDGDVSLPVEVKAARRRWRKVRPGYYAIEWRWHVANVDKSVDHLLALVAEDERGERFLFLVPSWYVACKRGLSITSHPSKYTGRLAYYREAWRVIGEVTALRRKYAVPGQLSFAGV